MMIKRTKKEDIYLEWIRQHLVPPLTMQGLAEAMGVSAPVITRMLQGKRGIKADELQPIADYLHQAMPTASRPAATVRHSDIGPRPRRISVAANSNWQLQKLSAESAIAALSTWPSVIVLEPCGDDLTPSVDDIVAVKIGIEGLYHHLLMQVGTKDGTPRKMFLRSLDSTISIELASTHKTKAGADVQYLGRASWQLVAQ